MKQNIIDRLFEINDDIEPTKIDPNYIIIDNFYKNYEDLHDYILNLPKTPKSNNVSKCINSRNVIEPRPMQLDKYFKILKHYIKKYYDKDTTILNGDVSINSIKIVTEISKEYQHWPHRDPGMTGIVYLDKISNGGTAIYEDPIDSKEHYDTLIPGKGYFRDTSKLNVLEIVESKPNRLVIFNALKLHGSYIYDHNAYRDKERFHQITFTTQT